MCAGTGSAKPSSICLTCEQYPQVVFEKITSGAFPSSPYQKLTRLAFTHALQAMLRRLQGLRCTHASHPAVARGYTNTGASHGELAARYPTEFSALLAQAFASELATHASRRVQRRSGAPLQPSAFPADATTISAPHAPPGPTTAQLRRIHIDTMAPYGIIKDSAEKGSLP